MLLLVSFSTTSGQTLDPAGTFLTAHLHPKDNIVGVTNGFVFETYTLDFQFIDLFTILDDSSIPLNQYTFVWSPDGSKLAIFLSGVRVPPINTILQIWDTATPRKLYEIPGVDGFTPVAWSPDGSRFATQVTTSDGTRVVRVHNAQTGQMQREIPSASISQLAWSPIGNQIILNNYSNVQVLSADTGLPLRTLNAVMDGQIDVAFSPSQNLIAFVNLNDGGNVLEIWNTDTGQLVHQLRGHTQPITQFQWSRGGLVRAGLDDTIRIWDPQTGQQLHVFQVGRYPLAELNADGTRLLVRDDTTGIHIRNAATGAIVAVLGGAPTPAPIVTPSPATTVTP
jgi:WD40 repeat protein